MKQTFASFVRPSSVKEVVGQTEIKDLLMKVIEKGEELSFLLYGKPGIGKTTLAYALCNDLHVTYSYFNAAAGNKKELKELIKINEYLIIDEIHRLNKDKQDILLPAIEFGQIKIVATTTENPFFVVNPAVRSRLHILELKEISEKEIVEGLRQVIKHHKLEITLSPIQLKDIALNSGGDYRYCLNVLNLLNKLFSNQKITKKILKTVMPSMHFFSDRNGDGHYNLLSAFHKSLRGSDVDASLFYLAHLINSGDIQGMERRLIAVAYEDVGLAEPNVALQVINAIESAKKLGFPEAKLPLANAVILLANAPKSNSAYLAINNAMELIDLDSSLEIPKHLKDSHYKSSYKLGNGIGYKYSHNYVENEYQQFLPDKFKEKFFYFKKPKDKLK